MSAKALGYHLVPRPISRPARHRRYTQPPECHCPQAPESSASPQRPSASSDARRANRRYPWSRLRRATTGRRRWTSRQVRLRHLRVGGQRTGRVGSPSRDLSSHSLVSAVHIPDTAHRPSQWRPWPGAGSPGPCRDRRAKSSAGPFGPKGHGAKTSSPWGVRASPRLRSASGPEVILLINALQATHTQHIHRRRRSLPLAADLAPRRASPSGRLRGRPLAAEATHNVRATSEAGVRLPPESTRRQCSG